MRVVQIKRNDWWITILDKYFMSICISSLKSSLYKSWIFQQIVWDASSLFVILPGANFKWSWRFRLSYFETLDLNRELLTRSSANSGDASIKYQVAWHAKRKDSFFLQLPSYSKKNWHFEYRRSLRTSSSARHFSLITKFLNSCFQISSFFHG